jgi:DUF971 family protein
VADTFSQKHRPIEIRLRRDEKILDVDFEDGVTLSLPAELLRVESPSAEVQGHSPSQKKTVSGRRHVGIMGVESVGNYAIRIKFDDMHDTGIFSWDFLHDMGMRKDVLWDGYIAELKAQGLSRDP